MALIDRGWYKSAFADSLKSEVCKIFGLTREQLNASKEVWRPLLVEWGRGRRRMNPAYWIKCVEDAYEALSRAREKVVITDCRYLNEASWIVNHGGILVYVSREGVGPANDEERTTIAEVLQNTRRLKIQTVYNNGPVEDLHKQIRQLAGLEGGS